jgi:cell division protein FtsI/penicillin-binding protein 2
VRTGDEGSETPGMAPTRRRGVHAARPKPAPSAAPKRVPQPAPSGRAPGTGSTGGKLVGGLRSRITLVRLVVAALLVGFVVAGMGDGWWSSPSAEPVVQDFLLDWQQQSYAAAATWTTGQPATVTAALKSAYRQLDAASFFLSMGHISQQGKTATAYFYASVDLGQNGAPWTYEGHFPLRLTPSGWKIAWSPSVINPALRPKLHLAVVSTTPHRAPLLDAEGRPLQTPSTAVVIGVQPDKVTSVSATAQGLGRITRIDPTEIQGWIVAAPRNHFTELLTLEPAQYHQWARALRHVPDLIVHHPKVLLFNSIAPAVVGTVGTEVSPALRNQGIAYRPGATVGLSGLQQHYQSYLSGSPTTEVVTVTSAGRQVKVLKTWKGHPPAAVRTTIEAPLQDAASKAVAAAPGAAAIVAMQASNGHILAVAEHTNGVMPALDALNGRYPPGGAFTIVSTEALLASGLPLDSHIPCYPSGSVGGQSFRNAPGAPSPGARATFAADFAGSCETAFGGLSQRQGMRQELSNAVRGFGLGAQWPHLPLKSFSGQVGDPGGEAQLASAIMGQGNFVQVSPLTMAGVAAQVDSGIWHEPSLVTKPDPQHAQQARFSATTMNSLRSLMRKTVQSGAGRRADVRGIPVHGQVGTTLLDGSRHHERWATWFVGYRGGIAFAVLEVTRSPRISAAGVAATFLRAAPRR